MQRGLDKKGATRARGADPRARRDAGVVGGPLIARFGLIACHARRRRLESALLGRPPLLVQDGDRRRVRRRARRFIAAGRVDDDRLGGPGGRRVHADEPRRPRRLAAGGADRPAALRQLVVAGKAIGAPPRSRRAFNIALTTAALFLANLYALRARSAAGVLALEEPRAPAHRGNLRNSTERDPVLLRHSLGERLRPPGAATERAASRPRVAMCARRAPHLAFEQPPRSALERRRLASPSPRSRRRRPSRRASGEGRRRPPRAPRRHRPCGSRSLSPLRAAGSRRPRRSRRRLRSRARPGARPGARARARARRAADATRALACRAPARDRDTRRRDRLAHSRSPPPPPWRASPPPPPRRRPARCVGERRPAGGPPPRARATSSARPPQRPRASRLLNPRRARDVGARPSDAGAAHTGTPS